MFFRTLFLFFVVFLCGRTASAQQQPLANTLLWEITGPELKQPSYLFGTIHIINANKFFWPDSLMSALDNCDQVSFEIDMEEMTNPVNQIELVAEIFMEDGTSLEDLLSPEDFEYAKKALSKSKIPFGRLMYRVKPIFLSTLLGDGTGSDLMPKAGAGTKSYENEIFKASKARKMRVDGLEHAVDQITMLDDIPYADQAQMMIQEFRNEDTSSVSMLDSMVTLYTQQNITALGNLMVDPKTAGSVDGFEDAMLYNRNRNWIPIMQKQMRRRPVFFAVGAGHLPGQNGVIDLLQKAGYTLRPVSPQP